MSRTYRRKNYPNWWWKNKEYWIEWKNQPTLNRWLKPSWEAEQAYFHSDAFDSHTPPRWMRRIWHKKDRQDDRNNLTKVLRSNDPEEVLFRKGTLGDPWDWY